MWQSTHTADCCKAALEYNVCLRALTVKCVGMQLVKVMEDCWNNEHREADLRFAKLLE